MFSRRSLCAFAVVSASLLLPARFALAQDAPKIRTVNPGRVFTEMQETKDLKQKITAESQRLQNQQTQRETELKEFDKARAIYNPGTAEARGANDKFLNKAVEYKAWTEIAKAELARDQKAQMARLFAKIEAATEEVAKAMNVDLVIVEQKVEMPNVDQIDQLSVEQIRALINQRNVMYSNGKLDITKEVLTKVDENYKAGK